ncbi:MAG TPA: hypothetical protein VK712_01125, partial [Verrucomicrobiae bacterium]|nr:hypothetical protein [Verrucomicrobiae bacterium]
TMAGKPYKDNLPFQIDTRAKSYTLSVLGFLGFTAVFYIVFTFLNLSGSNALKAIIALLVLAYIVLAVILDKYHVEIAAITNPLRKTK